MNLEMQSQLTILYNEPHRHYHNLNHILDLLGEYERYCADTHNVIGRDEIKYAIWWHDAIYNPYSSKNEENSAKLFRKSIPKDLLNGAVDRIEDMIKATAYHTQDQEFKNKYAHHNRCKMVMLDLDLHGLGAPYNDFVVAGDNIKREFSFVPRLTFMSNRVKFFQEMLKRKRIFYTDYFYNKYEAQARDNMQKDIIRIMGEIQYC